MPIHRGAEAVAHRLHGSVFHAFASPSTGSRELCAWRVEIPAGVTGVAHRVGREEILMLTAGEVTVGIDGATERVSAGDVLVVLAGTEFRVDNEGTTTAEAWVTTSVGFDATLPDGSTITPPWAR